MMMFKRMECYNSFITYIVGYKDMTEYGVAVATLAAALYIKEPIVSANAVKSACGYGRETMYSKADVAYKMDYFQPDYNETFPDVVIKGCHKTKYRPWTMAMLLKDRMRESALESLGTIDGGCSELFIEMMDFCQYINLDRIGIFCFSWLTNIAAFAGFVSSDVFFVTCTIITRNTQTIWTNRSNNKTDIQRRNDEIM